MHFDSDAKASVMLPVSLRPLPFSPHLVKKSDFRFLNSQCNCLLDPALPPGEDSASLPFVFPLTQRFRVQNCSAGGCFLPAEVPADPQKGQEGAGDRGRAKGEPQTRDCSIAPASDLGYDLGQARPFLASDF